MLLGVLIVLYVGTQLASSAVTAISADPTQRRIMFALPFVFVVFIINFPAGLIVYWITTNVWTIGQQLAVQEALSEAGRRRGRRRRRRATASRRAGSRPRRSRGRRRRGDGDGNGGEGAGQGASADGDGGRRKAPPPSPRKKKKRSGRRR